MKLVPQLLKLIAWIFIIFLILVMGILAFIQTPFAQRKIGEILTGITRTSNGGEVFFGSISGLIPYHIRVGDFRIRDGAGDWLVVKDADCYVSLTDLIHFRIRALKVEVGSASILRFPRKNDREESEENDDTPFTLRSLPSFTVDLFSVARVTVEETVLGEKVVATLKGYRIKSDTTDGGTLYLSLDRTDGKPGRMVLSAGSGADFSPLSAHIWIEEENGKEMKGLISSGSTDTLSLFFQGRGPIEKWKADLSARNREDWSIVGDLLLDLTHPLASGTLKAEFTTLPGQIRAQKGMLGVDFTDTGDKQNITATVQAKGLSLPVGWVGAIEGNINITDLLGTPGGTIKLKASNLHYPDTEEENPGGAVMIGAVTGDLSLSGTGPQTSAELKVTISDCTFPNLPTGYLEPLDISITGGLQNDRIHLSLDGGEQERFALQAEAETSVRTSLSPLSFHLPADAAITAGLKSRIDLELFARPMALSRQTLQGTVHTDLEAGGTIGNPELTGQIRMEKGRYRNLNTGTALNGITMNIQADQDLITLQEFAATTPRHGKVELTGDLSILPTKGFPCSFSLDLDSAELINMEELTASFSGKVILEGSLEEGRLHGTVVIDRARGEIPRTSPPTIPEIEVVEINRPAGGVPVKKASGPSLVLEKFALELQITAPENISVKGRGLDSEWKADITVRGTAARPLIKGGVELLDGIFIFMGEELEMKDCSVTIDGRFPPVPQLKINMEEVRSDITINLQIVGPITAPVVTLSSQPPYPMDEILARLLYGRSAEQLTGIQALQIANGLRTLQGK
ncbi:MAG: translocation/assembly module TamB domain-containing protein, partial [Candidatus Auribacterota bacterium]|nr:translocation/assembly module TamB domain-containing protein [Candidatus Auribacterota bacterium]